MDPVSAFSLVASVASVVQFSREAYILCSDMIENGSASQYRAAEEASGNLESSVTALRDRLQAAPKAERNADDERLVDIATMCISTASDLQTLLRKLKRDPQGGCCDTLRRIIRLFSKKSQIEQKRKDLETYSDSLQNHLSMRLDNGMAQSREGQHEIFQQLRDLGLAVEDSSARITEANLAHERSATKSMFMASLEFVDIFSRQEQISLAHCRTFKWIFGGTQESSSPGSRCHPAWSNFEDWLERSDNIYWIHGKAGSGKSTLMSYLVDHNRTKAALRKWCGPDTTLITPSFFFWNTGTALQKSVQGLLRSLVYQLLRGSEELLPLNSSPPPIWSEKRLREVLDGTLESATMRQIYICFFLDGLDEYEGETDCLMNWIVSLSGKKNVKICLSSRPGVVYSRVFQRKPQLRLQDLTMDDILRYVRDRLGAQLLQRSGDHDCDSMKCPALDSANCPHQLLQSLEQRAEGVFIWVRLVVSDLLKGLEAGETVRQLRHRLDDIPSEIHDLYAHMFRRLSKGFVGYASRYLSLMLAFREYDTYATSDRLLNGVTILSLAFFDEKVWTMVRHLKADFYKSRDFQDQCDRLDSHVLTCCAGIVELQDGLDSQLYTRRLNFIRRSAIEILLDAKQKAVYVSTDAQTCLMLLRTAVGYSFLGFTRDFLELAKTDSRAVSETPIDQQNHESPADFDDKATSDKPSTNEGAGRFEYSRVRVFHVRARNLLDMASFAENKILNCPDHHKEVHISYKETFDTIQNLLIKHVGILFYNKFRSIVPWQMKGTSIFLRNASDPGFWALCALRYASKRIQQCPAEALTDLDTVVDCAMASPIYTVDFSLRSLLETCHAAFERGASCARTVVMDFGRYPDGRFAFQQHVWCSVILRAAYIGFDSLAASEESASFLIRLIECCLHTGVDPNSMVQFPAPTDGAGGFWIRAMSVVSIIECLADGPQKNEILRHLTTLGCEPRQSDRYYVDENYTAHLLSEHQLKVVNEAQIFSCADNFGMDFTLTNESSARAADRFRVVENYILATLGEARRLGSFRSGLIIGDESTYEPQSQSDPPLSTSE